MLVVLVFFRHPAIRLKIIRKGQNYAAAENKKAQAERFRKA